jgi:hypothetical protein
VPVRPMAARWRVIGLLIVRHHFWEAIRRPGAGSAAGGKCVSGLSAEVLSTVARLYSTHRGYSPTAKLRPGAYCTSKETEAHTQTGKGDNLEKWADSRLADEEDYENEQS